MNANKSQNASRIRNWIPLAIAAAVALLWTLQTTAGTKTAYIAEEYPIMILEPGEWSFPSGNLHIQGHGGVNLLLSESPLLTGLLYWEGDLQWDPKGNLVANGTWALVVGDFEYDEDGLYGVRWGENGMPLFTATGGAWEGIFHTRWIGDMLVFHGSGKGVAGEADGLTLQGSAEQDLDAIPQIDTDVIMDPKAKK
jgi:hypothetical protein